MHQNNKLKLSFPFTIHVKIKSVHEVEWFILLDHSISDNSVYEGILSLSTPHLAWVVQKVDNTIHQINHYQAESVVCFFNTYPLDSDLSGG